MANNPRTRKGTPTHTRKGTPLRPFSVPRKALFGTHPHFKENTESYYIANCYVKITSMRQFFGGVPKGVRIMYKPCIGQKHSTIDLAEYVKNDGVELKWNGKRWFGCCPFHGEEKPSFSIKPDSNKFYCFGCGLKGDILDYVQLRNGVDIKGALKILGMSYQKLSPKEILEINKQKAINKERRDKKARFETWCIWYLDALIVERDVKRECLKAMTPDNFDEFCETIGGIDRIEHEIQIMSFGERAERIELYTLTVGKACRPYYDLGFYQRRSK